MCSWEWIETAKQIHTAIASHELKRCHEMSWDVMRCLDTDFGQHQYSIAPHRPSHCPSAWKHVSSHPMKIMQKMGSWQNDHHADNERCPMVNHADFGLFFHIELAPPIPDLRKKSLTPAVSSWGQSIWKEEKEMQLREEEYSEQLTLVDFYYQDLSGGWHGKGGSTPAKISGVSFPRWCMRFMYALCTVCIRFRYKIAPWHSQTWQNSIGFAALLGRLQTHSNECQSICRLLVAHGRRATTLCSANFINGKCQKVRWKQTAA